MSNQRELLKQDLEALQFIPTAPAYSSTRILICKIKDELENPDPKSTELRVVAIALRDYIDAIPDYLADQFPAMPGFDRDWVDEVISK